MVVQVFVLRKKAYKFLGTGVNIVYHLDIISDFFFSARVLGFLRGPLCFDLSLILLFIFYTNIRDSLSYLRDSKIRNHLEKKGATF